MGEEREITITFKDLLNVLIRRIWIILGVSILSAIGMFVYTYSFTPQYYEAKGLMYVNNKSITLDSISSITSSDLSAQKALVQSYSIIIQARVTIEDVIDKANLADKYSYEEVVSMLTVSSVNSTEIFSITCKCEDPADATLLISTILTVLPGHVEEIIEGTSASVVDWPADSAKAVSKGYTKKTFIAFAIALVLAYAAFFVFDILIDDTIKDAEWIKERYKDVAPLLAIVPDVEHETKSKYEYYASTKKEPA